MKKIKITKKGNLSIALDNNEYLQFAQVFQLLDVQVASDPFTEKHFADAISFFVLRDLYLKKVASFLSIGERNTLQLSRAEALAFFRIFNKQEVHKSFPAISILLSNIHQKLF